MNVKNMMGIFSQKHLMEGWLVGFYDFDIHQDTLST